MLDIATLARLGSVSRGWQKVCRARCRVICAHEVSQLAQLLPARHERVASEYLGRTPTDQCRGVYRLEQQVASGCWAATMTIRIKTLTGKYATWRVSSTAAAGTARFGVLGDICVGDLVHLIGNVSGAPVDQILLASSNSFRPAVHFDVPLMFYAVPEQRDDDFHISFEMLLRNSVNALDHESMEAFEATRREAARTQIPPKWVRK